MDENCNMNVKYVKFGSGPKTMVILPGLSLRPVTVTPQAVIDAYEIFAIFLITGRILKRV